MKLIIHVAQLLSYLNEILRELTSSYLLFFFFFCEIYKTICLRPLDGRPLRYHIRALQGRTYFTLIEDNKSLKHLHDCTLTITPKWLSE